MKKIFLCLAFLSLCLPQIQSSCIELLHAERFTSQALILVGKTGQSLLDVKIPSNYVGKDGRLLLPAEFTITKDGKRPLASFLSYGMYTAMPLALSGSHTVSLRIGSIYYQQRVMF